MRPLIPSETALVLGGGGGPKDMTQGVLGAADVLAIRALLEQA